ncbi:hypothetical protein C8R43DRAFT_1022352 [Mycena crocata]|nr:hypothetical protein C8R43DRAFT_1022352 [Mycena crocata]
MHPSLRLERLEELPFSLRKLAKDACNGSRDALLRITEDSHFGKPYDHLFLPVFYAILDPSNIPSAEEMDTIWETLSADSKVAKFYGAIVSLNRINATNNLPTAVLPELWHRTWAWSQFILVYHDHIPVALRPGLDTFCVVFVGLLHRFMATPEMSRLVKSTPGLRYTVVRAWRLILNTRNDPWSVCIFLHHDPIRSDVACLEEYFDGAGGSPEELAALVVDHINLVAHQTEKKAGYLHGVVDFLLHVDLEGTAFRAALLSHGLPKALTHALSFLVTKKPDGSERLQFHCLNLLAHELTSPEGFPYIGAELSSGLLDVILLCASELHCEADIRILKHWLVDVLPNMTVYHSILGHIITVLDGLNEQPQFAAPDIEILWDEFVELVNERRQIKTHFDSEEYSDSRACHNTLCGKIQEKRNFRRCADCLSAYYCSIPCQRIDWTEGHRKMCAAARAARHVPQQYMLNIRNRAFLRALLDHDYARNAPAILCQELEAMIAKQGFSYTKFDYLEYRPNPTVQLRPADTKDASWGYHERRVARSAGREALHVAWVRTGDVSLRLFFPMWSSDSRVYDGLKVLAERVAAGETVADLDVEIANLASLDVRTLH